MQNIEELKKVTKDSQGNFMTFGLLAKIALAAIELHEAGIKSEDIDTDGYSVVKKEEDKFCTKCGLKKKGGK